MKCDVIVVGAGIIGVSIALHLQSAGRSVMLIDRHGEAGSETSHGNAGLVERASVVPYGFPQSLSQLIRYGFNRSIDLRFSWSMLPKLAPYLFSYWRHSSVAGLASASRDLLPLIEASVKEHDEFIGQQPAAAKLFSRRGWIKAYASDRMLQEAVAEAETLAQHELNWALLDERELARLEPNISGMTGAIHWLDPITASDPGSVTAAYAQLFCSRGGTLTKGDAYTLAERSGRWTIELQSRLIEAEHAVVALGPWSADVLRGLSYRFPLEVKRGYHMHYRLAEGARLHHPILDAERGYVLAPMRKGVRLTTGVELSRRDAASTPIQLDRAEVVARRVLPLDGRVDDKPWIGFRPVFADMRPAIGQAPRHKNLWVAFGHGHHGFTMGPATGRLMSDMITGRSPAFDPGPFSPARFSGL